MPDSAEQEGGAAAAVRATAVGTAPESGAGAVHPHWQRVVVKLSGEAFSGKEPLGISPDVVYHIAQEILATV